MILHPSKYFRDTSAAAACVVFLLSVQSTTLRAESTSTPDARIPTIDTVAENAMEVESASGTLSMIMRDKSIVFQTSEAGQRHTFEINLVDGVATFDGDALVDNPSAFAELTMESKATVGGAPDLLTKAQWLRVSPSFRGGPRRDALLHALAGIRAGAELLSSKGGQAPSFSGREALISWSCARALALWGTAIAASWTVWVTECASGIATLACIGEVGALTTITTVGASQIGEACK